MRFSLIMATLNRTKEIEKFVESLLRQSLQSLELIIVDQNEDDRVAELLPRLDFDLNIIRERSTPGLSMARNVGLNRACGEILAFPDDDCLYPPQLLQQVSDWFDTHPDQTALSGRSVDENGTSTVSLFESGGGAVTKENIWRRMTSISLFVRRNDTTRNYRFNPELGLGSPHGFGAGEDIDFPLQLISHGHKIFYDPVITVYHPAVTQVYGESASRRAYLYGGGIGRVLTLHQYPWHRKAKALLRPLGGTALSYLTARPEKARFHWNAFKGRLRGMVR